MIRPALPLAFAIALLTAAPAAAYDLVVNGGFETASLSSWTPFSQGASGGTGGWYAKSSGNGTYSGLPISPPPAGSWEAVADNSGRVAAILYQDIAIPPTTKATLSFIIWHGNAASGNVWTNGTSLSPTITNQRVRVDIVPTTQGNLITSGALAVVYQTASGTPQIVNPTTVSLDVTALAGQTVRLRFALVATQGGLIAGIDQVKLDVSPFSLSPAAPPAMYSSDAHWGDFDGDGQFEIAMEGATLSSGITGFVERYSGGTWSPMVTLPTSFAALALGDVDGNGTLDLALNGNGAGYGDVAVFHNDGGGGFTPSYEHVGAANGSIAWGDADRDGDLDALLTGFYSAEGNTTYLGRNDGAGHLTFVPTGMRGIQGGQAIWANVQSAGIRQVALVGNGATDFYSGDGNGGFSGTSLGFVDVADGRIAMGDLDNDGIDEMVLVGTRISDGSPTAKIYKLGMFGWTEAGSGLTGVQLAAVTLGDFDNDGYLDIAINGQSSNSPVTPLTRVYHNNGNLTFSDVGASLQNLTGGAIEFGDFDGDGDLDLLVQGVDPSLPHTLLAINQTPTVNTAPSPPSLLSGTLTENEVWLTFSGSGFDDHTPPQTLTRNFRAGTSSGAIDLISPMSDLTTGRRMLPEPGEAGHESVARLVIDRIGHNQSVWWSVQNVDQSDLGSPWAAEQRVVIGPVITSVTDIPNDQGGHVRVTLQKSPLDDGARTFCPAAGYDVWRLVPPGRIVQDIAREGTAVREDAARAHLAAASRTGDEAASASLQGLDLLRGAKDLSLVEWNGRLFVRSAGRTVASPFPAGTWEIVGSFFATQASSYVVATTTLADSGSGGVNDQTYMVTVHTTTPSVWFASLPVSGHSVDNIAPAAPVGLAAAYHTGSGNHLTWQPAPETDFESFRVYRGSSPGFVAGPASLVASVPSPTWTDPSYDSPLGAYYKVSTTDHAGNESAAVAPGSTTAVGGSGDLTPLVFALGAPSPNPFGVETALGFSLPAGSLVRLEVFDASGRRVRTLVNGWIEAGAHAVRWDGSGDAGARLGAGVYFCRLEAGSQRAMRRVALMK